MYRWNIPNGLGGINPSILLHILREMEDGNDVQQFLSSSRSISKTMTDQEFDSLYLQILSHIYALKMFPVGDLVDVFLFFHLSLLIIIILKDQMTRLYSAISNGRFEIAYSILTNCLKCGLYGGSVFSIIVDGLKTFGYLSTENHEEDCLGPVLLNLERSKCLHLFKIMNYILHNFNSLPGHTFNQCFLHIRDAHLEI